MGALTVLRSDTPNWVYRYGTRPGEWIQILPDTGGSHEAGGVVGMEEPQPRYAHQVVYDEGSKTVFMHGGNAGLGTDSSIGMEKAEERDDGEEKAEEEIDISGREKQEQEHELKERRLDDFWSMTLSRCDSVSFDQLIMYPNVVSLPRLTPAEIIRRAIYLIRQQQ